MDARDPTRTPLDRRSSSPAVRPVVRRRPGTPLPDVLLGLDAQFADILGMLDRAEAVRRIVTRVPDLVGVDMAWVGDPGGGDRIVLGHTVNSTAGLIDGLVVPMGAGLGGKVLASRRPLWVSDYCATSDISDHFKSRCAGASGVVVKDTERADLVDVIRRVVAGTAPRTYGLL